MNIVPLAFDSLGVRSMATFVETDLRIMIDPGLDLAPLRYGLPPSKTELERVKELSVKINEYAEQTDFFFFECLGIPSGQLSDPSLAIAGLSSTRPAAPSSLDTDQKDVAQLTTSSDLPLCTAQDRILPALKADYDT